MVPGATAKRHTDKHESRGGPFPIPASVSLRSHSSQKTRSLRITVSQPCRRRSTRDLSGLFPLILLSATLNHEAHPRAWKARTELSRQPREIGRVGAFGHWASSQAATLSYQISPKRVREPGHATKRGPSVPTALHGPRPAHSLGRPPVLPHRRALFQDGRDVTTHLEAIWFIRLEMSLSALTHRNYLSTGLPSDTSGTAPAA